MLAVALGWPIIAYVCGLYALDDLRSWASGIGDAPRLAVTALLISWPLFGVLTLLRRAQPRLRRPGRHRADRRRRRHGTRRGAGQPAPLPRPAPAHADPRIGRRRAAARRPSAAPQGTRAGPGRLHRRRRPPSRGARHPAPGHARRAQRPDRVRPRRPRDDRLHARQPRGSPARDPRLPRRGRDRGHRPPPVRVPRGRALVRADRRHAADVDPPAVVLAAVALRQALAGRRRRELRPARALAGARPGGDRDQARHARPRASSPSSAPAAAGASSSSTSSAR